MKYRIRNTDDNKYVPIFDYNGFDKLGYNRNKGQVVEMFLTDGETVFVLKPNHTRDYTPRIYRVMNQGKFIVELATSKTDIGDVTGEPFTVNDVVKIYKYQYPENHDTNWKLGRVFIEDGNFNIILKGEKEYKTIWEVFNDNYKLKVIGTIHDEQFKHLKGGE